MNETPETKGIILLGPRRTSRKISVEHGSHRPIDMPTHMQAAPYKSSLSKSFPRKPSRKERGSQVSDIKEKRKSVGEPLWHPQRDVW